MKTNPFTYMYISGNFDVSPVTVTETTRVTPYELFAENDRLIDEAIGNVMLAGYDRRSRILKSLEKSIQENAKIWRKLVDS